MHLMPWTRAAVATLATAILAPNTALGHVAAAEDVDNRYIKVTPMADRVRLAYTIYVGHKPGALLRRRLDTDNDQSISDAESNVYGDEVAARVSRALQLTLDGRAAPVEWKTISVGLGQPDVQAGALSVDLIGWICTSPGQHQLQLRDTLVLERPGETELRLDALPGVQFGERSLSGERFTGLDTTWNGSIGPLATPRGLELQWSSPAGATHRTDDICHLDRPARRRVWPWIAAFAALLTAMETWRRTRHPPD
jgi:hypothetical protein